MGPVFRLVGSRFLRKPLISADTPVMERAAKKEHEEVFGEGAGRLPRASRPRQVIWLLGAGVWLFLFISLASFSSADPPSHVVAIHNEPVANLCGNFGALIAYWSYNAIGIGAWVLLLGFGSLLGVTVTGRAVDHILVRAIGLTIAAIAVSGIHALLLPSVGPLAGAQSGLIAQFGIAELTSRFSTVGTFLIVLIGLGLGLIVATDHLLFATLRWTSGVVSIPRKLPKVGLKIGQPVEDVADVEEDEEEEELPVAQPIRKKLTPDELREKIAMLPVRMSGSTTEVARDEDIPRMENFEEYQFPTLELLTNPETNYSEKMESFVRKQAQHLEESLQTYGIDGEVVGIESGPVVTLYSVQLAPGTKVAKVTTIANDLARSLRAHNIRIVTNMAGKTTVGIEVPNPRKERVRLKELMSGGQSEGMMLPMFLGKDVSGEPLVADLTTMPHMLIAGTTGSGKSVCINTIIMSWLYTKRPDELKLILVDPKMVELNQFSDIPHLMCPVVTETHRAAAILEWAVARMEERYELLNEAMVRDIASFNALSDKERIKRFEPETDEEEARIPKHLPYMVFVIDELADLILTNKEVEHSIVRIAQKARAVGIHLILATQRPQANVVTGLIKSNMPCRVSFKVASGMDSRIVLDQKGAELLLGQGDMLFLTPHTSEVKRAQGTLVTDQEIRKVAGFLKTVALPTFERALLNLRIAGDSEAEDLSPDERDPLFDEAVRIMIETGRGSVSLLQRRLAIGYSRASRLVDQMSMAGILGDHKGTVAREVLITLEEWEQMKEMEEAAAAEGTLYEDEEEYEDAPEIESVSREKAGCRA